MKKNLITLIFAFACLFAGIQGMAQSVTKSEADQVCQRFLMDKQKMKAGDTPIFKFEELMLNKEGQGYLYRYSVGE